MPRTKRKDKSRAVLRTGESQRADGTYQFRWTDSNHKRFCVYAKTLDELRYKEEQKKELEADLEQAIQKGRRCGISDEDIKSLFELILEG